MPLLANITTIRPYMSLPQAGYPKLESAPIRVRISPTLIMSMLRSLEHLSLIGQVDAVLLALHAHGERSRGCVAVRDHRVILRRFGLVHGEELLEPPLHHGFVLVDREPAGVDRACVPTSFEERLSSEIAGESRRARSRNAVTCWRGRTPSSAPMSTCRSPAVRAELTLSDSGRAPAGDS